DLDLVEANEAFAAQACAVNKDMGWDPSIVNVNGGAIALGHPVGASAGRITMTLAYELQRRGGGYGVAAICGGLAQGEAVILKV
ncbi:MAG: acetyl-CoA C-acyltransferase, partial [Deltaproteobacteria bacterium HGW-Deltaproteobacteria-11]